MTGPQIDGVASLLDRIDPARHEVQGVVRGLNEYESLGPEVQDQYYELGGAMGYVAVEVHPLTALCGEAHNSFFVLRDLDGSLQFVFEISPGGQRWEVGPLYRGNLSDVDLEPYLLDGEPLESIGIPLSVEEFAVLLSALPDDPPGPLRRY
jgi:hypothetical protein